MKLKNFTLLVCASSFLTPFIATALAKDINRATQSSEEDIAFDWQPSIEPQKKALKTMSQKMYRLALAYRELWKDYLGTVIIVGKPYSLEESIEDGKLKDLMIAAGNSRASYHAVINKCLIAQGKEPFPLREEISEVAVAQQLQDVGASREKTQAAISKVFADMGRSQATLEAIERLAVPLSKSDYKEAQEKALIHIENQKKVYDALLKKMKGHGSLREAK